MENIRVGDVVYTRWGYDQTNIDYYQVVDKTGKITYALQRVGSLIVDDAEESNSSYNKVIPDLTNKQGGAFKKRLGKYGFKIYSFAYASLWDGNPKSETAFGYGH